MLGALLAATLSWGADTATPSAKVQAEQDAMMKAWMEFATPSDGHKRLASLAGTWSTKSRFWVTPGAPPQENAGAAQIEWVLGGRYLQQTFTGEYMGKPFHGIGYWAYDNIKKKYLSAWMDDLGTSIMQMTGSMDKAGKTLTTTGAIAEVITKKPIKVKEVLTLVDAEHFTDEMWTTGSDGKASKSFEIAYTRKK